MIATNIEQSKKLVELGIDANTADMFWGYIEPYCFTDRQFDGGYEEYPLPKEFPITDDEYSSVLFAWSLEALLKLIPKYIKQEDGRTYKFYIFNDDGIVIQRWGCSYVAKDYNNRAEYLSDPTLKYPTNVYSDKYDSPLDAAFEMIVWLKENKYI